MLTENGEEDKILGKTAIFKLFNKNYSGVTKLKHYSDFCSSCWNFYTDLRES